MDFVYNEEQECLRRQARMFARDFIEPEALEYDRRGVFALRAFREMGEKGFFGLIVPKEFGGLGLSTLEYSLVSQEIAKASPAYSHNGTYQCQKALLMFGTEEQKRRYLPGLARGEKIGAIAISEENVGSSFKGMQTYAKKIDNVYVVNGHKTHINDAAEADVILLLAKTDGGLSCFIIEKNQKGFTILEKLDPTGYRASPIYKFALNNAELAEKQRLSHEGEGLKVFFGIFNFSRIGNASVFIGLSFGALDSVVDYAKQRKVGNFRVVDFQGVRWQLADLYTKLDAAVLLRDKAAIMEASGVPCARETCQAKYFAGEVAREITNKAIEISGSYGCYRDRPLDMFLRDAKALLIAGGSSEVMKNVISDLTLGKSV